MSIYEGSIDDNDPQIIYSDGWVLVTSDGDWRGTMHSTSNIGASARVRFTGTRIAFICTIPTGDGQLSQAAFSIDGGAAVRITHATTLPVQWQTTFWDSGPLPYGSHLVTMTNTGNEAYLRLDRIDYDPTTANAPRVSSSALTPAVSAGGGGGDKTTTVRSTLTSVVVVPGVSDTRTSSTTTSLVASLGGQSSQPPSASLTSSDPANQTGSLASSTNSIAGSSSSPGAKLNDSDSGSSLDTGGSAQKTSTPVAAIVGGVLGALLAIALLALVLLYCHRKRARSAAAAYLDDPSTAAAPSKSRWTKSTVPTPFSVGRRSHETPSASNLMVQTQTQTNGQQPYRNAGTSAETSNTSPSSPFSDSRGVLSTSASISMYHSESSSSAGVYGSQQYQQNGAGAVANASSSKHAEFVAEQQQQRHQHQQQQQQQQMQQIDTQAVAIDGGIGGQHCQYGGAPSSVGPFQDEAPPPAYPGVVQHVEPSPGASAAATGSGWKS